MHFKTELNKHQAEQGERLGKSWMLSPDVRLLISTAARDGIYWKVQKNGERESYK